MADKSEVSLIEKIKAIVLDIKSSDVIKDAQSAGLTVESIPDFRDQAHNYWRIEDVMHQYAGLAARYSAMSGASSGVGGVATAVTLGGVDIANMAAQLYRLGQRLAVLNGFDPEDSLQKEKIQEIYLLALGFDTTAQATIKQQMLKAAEIAGKRGAKQNPILKLIIFVAEKLGKDITTKQAAKFIPVIGAFAGAGLNYYFAKSAANSMIESYKREFFRTWQAGNR